MKRKVLVLGGGLLQVPLLKMAKQKGFTVFLADYNKSPPGEKYCDRSKQISTFSIIDNYEYALAEKVDHLLTIGTDQPVYTAAVVSACLNLPYPISPEQGKMVTNKYYMKTRMVEKGIPTPRFQASSRFQDVFRMPLNYPLVMKPVDSQGQRGIFILNGSEWPEQIRHLFTIAKQHSLTGMVIIEEFYQGDEITVNCWVKDGRAFVLLVTDRLHFNDEVALGICKQQRFPSRAAEAKQKEIEAIVQQLANAFAIRDGPLYLQMVTGREGIKVIEFGYRIGGGFESETIPRITGVDILELYFTLITEGRNMFQPKNLKEQVKLGSVLFMFAKPGLVAGIKMPSQFKTNGKLFIKERDEIGPIANATSRIGCFTCYADRADDYYNLLARFDEEMSVFDQNNTDLLIHNLWE